MEDLYSPIHQSGMAGSILENTETLENGDLRVYVRIHDEDLNVASDQNDWLVGEIDGISPSVDPVKISVLREI